MYYAEKIINGVLCWRGTPDGKWIQKTKQQTTELPIAERKLSEHGQPIGCRHIFVRDEEAIRHQCCQKCGVVITDDLRRVRWLS